MSTLFAANIHFDTTGQNQVNYLENEFNFKLGGNSNVLPRSLIPEIVQKVVEATAVASGTLPANSYIISFSNTAPTGHVVVTGTGYPSYIYVYKKT